VSIAEVLDNARRAVELDPVRLAAETDKRRYWRHFWVAVVISPALEVCEALLRNESVPVARLDAAALRRFGLR
jgi:hypothetical protein